MRREKAGVWREVCVEGGSMEGGVRGGRCVEGDSVEGGVWRKINDYRCGGGGGGTSSRVITVPHSPYQNCAPWTAN